ncbi:3-isopropylmalate dehydrogenase [Candidatus Aerophobetes bacterium]|uniref:3-isopropylmalate dehydrogenase n=1 Tax=Aerophobetes bacterium TaxID=2030807 RepID=A0A497E2S6_UNCAE|nr:MAG: 3-isopropylmalate dehydrogenase [Candidatus Aerophobetes bacterium]
MPRREHKIAVIPGDGIGPEVTREALKVLRTVSEKAGFEYQTVEYDFGAERYLKTGETLPDSALNELKEMDAIFLGAVGDPRVEPGILEKGILLKLRFGLDQYINLRPVKLYPGVWTPLRDKGPEDIDFVVIRENTEGLYLGLGGIMREGTPDEVAIQEMVNTRKGVERCVRYAFEYTRRRNRKKKLTLCDKANVLTYVHGLWRRVFEEVGKEYPDIEKDYAFVDATCMWMVKNPEWFDVIVTCNMFGDIITDLGAIIQGGMGIAAGANINPQGVSMFEPIHGSAPKYAGKNMANPLAAICAVQMMLEQIGEDEAARMVDNAIAKTLSSGKIKDLSARSGLHTDEIGDMVVRYI